MHTDKFDLAVQGTLLRNDLTEPEIYVDITAVPEAPSDGLITVNESVRDSSTSIADISTSAVTSNLLLYVILGAAGGILILLIIIPILCGIVYCLATGKSCITPTPAQVEIVIQGKHGWSSIHKCFEYACILSIYCNNRSKFPRRRPMPHLFKLKP